MKARNIIILLAVICLYANGYAQNKISQNDLIGQWKFDYVASFSELSDEANEKLNSSASYRSRIEKAYVNRVIKLEEGGVYKQSRPDGTELIGKWTLNTSSQELIVTAPNGQQIVQRIEVLTDKDLLLVPVMDKNTSMLIGKWYFTKL